MEILEIREAVTIKHLESAIAHFFDRGKAYGELIGVLVEEGHALTSPQILKLAQKVGLCTVGYNIMDAVYGQMLERFYKRQRQDTDADG